MVLVRHGETDWNRGGRIQGHTDVPLNARGVEQAARLAAALQEDELDAIYSSDLRRAIATAEAIATGRGRDVRQEPALRERGFGRFEGLSWDEISERFPDDARRWRQREPDFAVGGGESLTHFSARCVGALLELTAQHPGGCIAVVAHGGVLDCLYRAALRIDLQATRSWALGNATINRLLVSHGELSVVGWNDDRHLDGLMRDEATS